MNDSSLLKNRFADMAERSDERNIWVYSDFLTEAEQSELIGMRLGDRIHFFGGYENAERVIAVFGNENDIFYPPDYPIAFIKIEPVSRNAEKFDNKLTHRDYLGSLMALGIRREMLGDIIIDGRDAYVVCLTKIADYIADGLSEVRHTTVKCSVTDSLPESTTPEPVYEEIIVSSARVDALAAAVYKLSRSVSQNLILGEKVFLNGAVVKSASAEPKIGDKISVRGYGRFVFVGVVKSTKKGRLVIGINKF